MNHSADTDIAILPLIKERWSPYAFDPTKPVAAADLTAVFEAARWAMSSYNAQPWRYIVADRFAQPERWQQVLDVLVDANQPWAKNAPVLALGLVRSQFEHNGKPNKSAQHDLGAASAFLTLEATARGLMVHQMAGIEPGKARIAFNIDADLEAFTGLALGYSGSAAILPEAYAQRDQRPRERKPLNEIVSGLLN